MGKKQRQRQRQFRKTITELVAEGVGLGPSQGGQSISNSPWDLRALAAAQGNRTEVRTSGKSHRWWQSLR